MTSPDHSAVLELVRVATKKLAALDIEGSDVLRIGAWGDSNIAEARPLFEAVKTLAGHCARAEYSLCPVKTLQQLNALANKLQNQIDALVNTKISDLAANNQQIEAVRNQRLDQLQTVYLQFFNAASQALGTETIHTQAQIEEVVAEHLTDTIVKERRQEIEAELETAKTMRGEIEAALEAAKKASAESGLSAQAQHFDGLRAAHRIMSTRWLVASVAAAAAWFVAAGLMYGGLHRISADSVSHTIVNASFRFILLSVGLIIVVWCARTSRHHKHNEILNEHRATALSTFESFVEAAERTETREAVLLQATSSIFSVQPTGFGTDGDSAKPPSVIEILRPSGD